MARRSMSENFENFLRSAGESFKFRGNPRIRWIVISILFCATFVSAYVVFNRSQMSWSVPLTIILAAVLFVFLAADSIIYVFDLLHSSPREVLPLVRSIDPLINKAITDSEGTIKDLTGDDQKKEITSQAREICSDFESRPPYPRITIRLFRRTVINFLFTVSCFAFITMTLTRWDAYCNIENPGYVRTYAHDCAAEDNYGKALLHSFYYNSVIFQSLGDGSHAPKTAIAQAIATGETLTAFLYLTLIFGGIYNAGSIVRDNLTPARFESSLIAYLTTLSSSTSPVTKEDIMSNAATRQ